MVASSTLSALLEKFKTDTKLPWMVVDIDNAPALKSTLDSGVSLVVFPVKEGVLENEFVLAVYNKSGTETLREYCDEYDWLIELLESASFL